MEPNELKSPISNYKFWLFFDTHGHHLIFTGYQSAILFQFRHFESTKKLVKIFLMKFPSCSQDEKLNKKKIRKKTKQAKDNDLKLPFRRKVAQKYLQVELIFNED